MTSKRHWNCLNGRKARKKAVYDDTLGIIITDNLTCSSISPIYITRTANSRKHFRITKKVL
jgi:hypothetical protein